MKHQPSYCTQALLGGAFLLLLAIGISSPSSASDQIPAKPQDHPIALVGATIHPVVGPVIEHGMILFDGGKIIAIGASLQLPREG